MFARFDENPAMTLRVIKETKRYGRTDGWTDGRTDGRTDARTDNVKTVYPLQTKFAGGINRKFRQIGSNLVSTCSSRPNEENEYLQLMFLTINNEVIGSEKWPNHVSC